MPIFETFVRGMSADGENDLALVEGGEEDLMSYEEVSGAPPPAEGAQKRQRVGEAGGGVSAAFGRGPAPEAASGAAGGQRAHQVGPPPKSGNPQPGADRQPPKPRKCRLCDKEFPSGAALFKHLPECRAASRKAAAVGAKKAAVEPSTKDTVTSAEQTLAEEVAKADELGLKGGRQGPAVTVTIGPDDADLQENALGDFWGPFTSGLGIKWLACPTRAVAAEPKFAPVVVAVHGPLQTALGLRVGDEIREITRYGAGRAAGFEREQEFNAPSHDEGATGDGPAHLQSVLALMEQNLGGEDGDEFVPWTVRVRRHAAVRPVPTVAGWPSDAEEDDSSDESFDGSPGGVWAAEQQVIAAGGGLGDFCHCCHCARVRKLRRLCKDACA